MAYQEIPKGSGPSAETAEDLSAVQRLKIENILCPVDFSDFSRRALHYAFSLARHFGSRLLVQHTVQPPAYLFLEGQGVSPSAVQQYVQGQMQGSREEIARMLLAGGAEPAEVSVLLNVGNVCDHIVDTIAKEQIDLLIMGTHGRKGFNRWVLGSVTQGMVHRAACPVLVVGQPRRGFAHPEESQTIQLRTILLATDFSADSDRALAYALSWGCEWGAKVVVFHAVEEIPAAMKGVVDLFPEYNPYFDRQVASAWAQIRQLIPEAAEAWCEVSYEVRHSNPKEEILRVAEEKRADLIIMGARGGGSAVPWGSVSSAVVGDGRFPVMVVPAAAERVDSS